MTRRLHVERWGQRGPAVLLIHGLGGSGRYWRRVAELLEQDVQGVAPDLLGFGRSPWPDSEYTIDDHLDALDATLLAEGLAQTPLVLVGHSLGTVLALAWAARHPRRFGSLVLIGLPCYRSPQEARRHVAGLGPLAYATVARPKLGARICALMCFGRPFWRLVVPTLMPGIPADVARDGVLHTWRSYSLTLRHGILHADVWKLARQVADAGVPARLLHGDRDREAPPQGVAELARATGWPLVVLSGSSHALPLERPQACAEAIRGLLGTTLLSRSAPGPGRRPYNA